MRANVTRLPGSVVALAAGVGLDVAVDAGMPYQSAPFGEPRLALAAGVGLLLGVGTLMLHKVPLLCEGAVAVLALVGLDAQVGVLMPGQAVGLLGPMIAEPTLVPANAVHHQDGLGGRAGVVLHQRAIGCDDGLAELAWWWWEGEGEGGGAW